MNSKSSWTSHATLSGSTLVRRRSIYCRTASPTASVRCASVVRTAAFSNGRKSFTLGVWRFFLLMDLVPCCPVALAPGLRGGASFRARGHRTRRWARVRLRRGALARRAAKTRPAQRGERPPTHPGEMLLEEVLRPLGISQVGFARQLGVSFPRLAAKSFRASPPSRAARSGSGRSKGSRRRRGRRLGGPARRVSDRCATRARRERRARRCPRSRPGSPCRAGGRSRSRWQRPSRRSSVP